MIAGVTHDGTAHLCGWTGHGRKTNQIIINNKRTTTRRCIREIRDKLAFRLQLLQRGATRTRRRRTGTTLQIVIGMEISKNRGRFLKSERKFVLPLLLPHI